MRPRWIATLLVLAGALVSPRLEGQISPGPLARAHASLEGSLQCTQCHGTRKEALPGQCVACHREIAWLRQQGRGLHAPASMAACASCHPEHAGSDFALVSWTADSLRRFDHARTGWKLEGAHATLECGKCHQSRFQNSPGWKLLPGTRTSTGWLGLERDCAGCHRDPHGGALGKDCTSCHGAEKWKPVPGFDHARTSYPLTGAHVDVACAKCHADPRMATRKDSTGAPVPVYKPLPHAQCSACHNDPHAGKFGAVCSQCHQTRSFTAIDSAGFNHSRTRYPLQGRHAAVACARCHERGGVKVKDPAFAACGSCHGDAHAGLALIDNRPADCAACHTTQGFAVASFTLAQHAATRYPLEGKHQTVECESCHARQTGTAARSLGTSGIVMRPASTRCTSCHGQDHGMQLANRRDNGECSTCHTVAGWTPSRFGLTEHAELRLTLTGRHAEIACAACHGPDRQGLPPVAASPTVGRARVLLAIGDVACTVCHADPHGGQLKSQQAGGAAGGCPACHNAVHFRPSVIDVAAHRNYGFILDGAHAATPCTACHETLGRPRPAATLVGNRSVVAPWLFPVKGTTCTSCHTTPHGPQFDDRADHGRCEACHDTGGFRPAARFDHGRDTSFPLSGGHAGVACSRCHRVDPARAGDGPRYRGLSSRCESCHAGGTPPARPS
ncbi:MAG TPA: cytochrome c3 family protein [Gemmatimonadales bacterium]|nr:cytochrome c3 family protein [Gemmatimonadales bacterium]